MDAQPIRTSFPQPAENSKSSIIDKLLTVPQQHKNPVGSPHQFTLAKTLPARHTCGKWENRGTTLNPRWHMPHCNRWACSHPRCYDNLLKRAKKTIITKLDWATAQTGGACLFSCVAVPNEDIAHDIFKSKRAILAAMKLAGAVGFYSWNYQPSHGLHSHCIITMKSSWQILHHIGVIWLKTGVRLKLEPNKTTGDYPLPTAQDVDRVIVYMLDHALVTFDNERVAAFKSFGMVRKG